MARSISKNAALSVGQVIITGIILFLLYKYLLEELGVAKVGVWSVVAATVSASRVAQLGFSGSTIKYVAKYLSHEHNARVSECIQTAAISTAVILGAVVLLIYPVLIFMLNLVIPNDGIVDAQKLLPYSLLALLLGSIANVFLAGLDGYQRIDTRAYINITAYIIFFASVIYFVNAYSLVGVAYAQIVQSLFQLLAGWISLKHVTKNLPLFPWKWNKHEFRTMLGYGVNFQIVSFMQMLYEPGTKLLLSYFGGLAVTGYYEMANRMVFQLRSLFVAGNQVLVPVIADTHEKNAVATKIIYQKSYRLIYFLSAPFFCLVISLTPSISNIWIGHHEPVFIFSSIVLCIAWWVNILCTPAYFTYLGTGRLLWVILGAIITAVINILLGLGLGVLIGDTGPIIAWAIALTVGSLLYVFSYNIENSIDLSNLMPRESFIIVVSSIFVATLSLVYQFSSDLAGCKSCVVLALFAAFIAPLMWMHPFRKRIIEFCATNRI